MIGWVSKSPGAPGPAKGTLHVTTWSDGAGWSTKDYPPLDPDNPPADLPQWFKDELATEDGKKWYADPPPGDECSSHEDLDGLEDLDELDYGTDPTADDTDLDGFNDMVEVELGSNPLLASSTPEDVSVPGSCADAVDNDLDLVSDLADDGCLDTDGDGVSNAHDNCVFDSNAEQIDWDGDDEGAPCDDEDDGDMVLDSADLCTDTFPSEPVDSFGCSQRQRSASLVLSVGYTGLSWTSFGVGVSGYDIVRGSLGVLRTSRGDFTTATDLCVANNVPTTSFPYTANPPTGQGDWFLVREVYADGTAGTYDSPDTGLLASRDMEIAASPAACP